MLLSKSNRNVIAELPARLPHKAYLQAGSLNGASGCPPGNDPRPDLPFGNSGFPEETLKAWLDAENGPFRVCQITQVRRICSPVVLRPIVHVAAAESLDRAIRVESHEEEPASGEEPP
jgi:hypothetical protein